MSCNKSPSLNWYGSDGVGALCGQGYDFILEKINGKWKVIKRDYTWIS
ncbi:MULTISPECIES: hypothetical protein [Sphingobacterium]|nr:MULTISPECIES: hypothetical protein [Sphingobacterium]